MVKRSVCETDLGVDIDSNLSFDDHISAKVKSASSLMGAIRRSFTFLDVATFKLLFRGLCRSKLEYAAAVWSPSNVAQVNVVEQVQRSATAMLPGMRDLSYEERLRKVQMTTLRSRRLRGDMIECWKVLHGEYDADACPSLPLRAEQPGIPTLRSHPLDLRMQRCNTTRRRTSFTQRIVPVWNSLPASVKEAKSMNSFKNRLDNAWKDHQFLYNPEIQFPRGVIVGGVSS